MKHKLFRTCMLVGAAGLFAACRDNQPITPISAPSGTPSFAETVASNGSESVARVPRGVAGSSVKRPRAPYSAARRSRILLSPTP